MNDEQLEQNQVMDGVDELQVEEVQIGCRMCGSLEIEEGFQVELCEECRKKLCRRPLPVWVKCIFVFMIAILAVALIRFPSTIKAGIAFERGSRAEAAGKYLTAANQYKIVTERFPDSTISLARLFVSTYNNGKIEEAYNLFKKIEGRNPKEQDLVIEVNKTIERIGKMYMTSDELNNLINGHQNDKPEQMISVLKTYLSSNPADVQASYYLSNLLFDQKKYDEAEKNMAGILAANPDFYNGHLFMAAVYRETGSYDKAVESCNKVILHNVEYPSAYTSLARVELKFHNDQKGLDMAKKAYELDHNDSHVVATLSLAYHYNNMLKERDEMFKEFKEINDNNTYDLELLNKIYSGQEKWRS